MSPLAQTILVFLLSLGAGFVGGSLRPASRSTSDRKRLRELEMMVSDLESSFESLMTSHKRLRSREGMQRLRNERAEEPRQETKAEARRRMFGVASGPEFARIQQRIDGNRQI